MSGELHSPRLAKEEQLAVSFFTVVIASGLYLSAMLQTLIHVLTTDSRGNN